MKIAIISGSNRTGRQSLRVAQHLLEVLDKHEKVTRTILLDVHTYNFPVMDERLGHLETPHAGLVEFSDHIKESQGLIIVTPEYNGGMAGSLKNTLDYFRKEFSRLPMAAVTVSSGSFGGANALHQLWWWMLYNGGIVSPTKLLVSNVVASLSQEESKEKSRFDKNSHKFIDDLMWLAEKIKSND